MKDKATNSNSFSAIEKEKIVLSIISEESTLVEAAEENGISTSEVDGWRQMYIAGLRSRCNRNRFFSHLRSSSPIRKVPLIVCALLLVAFSGGIVLAGSPQCDYDEHMFCFESNTPALASEVRSNFKQLYDWIEQKVGTVGESVRIEGPARIVGVATIGNGAGTAIDLTDDADITGVDIIEGFNDLRFNAQPGNVNDVVIHPNADVEVRTNLSVNGNIYGNVEGSIGGAKIFLKDGNNGTVSCGEYCADSQWGNRAGGCIGTISFDDAWYNPYDCNEVVGAIDGVDSPLHPVKCICVDPT